MSRTKQCWTSGHPGDASSALCRLVRISLLMGLLVAGYTLVQGILNRSTLAQAWGAATPWVLVAHGLGCVALALATQRPPAAPAVLRAGFCVLVLWWLTYVLLLQPYDRFAVEVSLGVAAGLYGLAVLVASRLTTRRPAGLLRMADFALS